MPVYPGALGVHRRPFYFFSRSDGRGPDRCRGRRQTTKSDGLSYLYTNTSSGCSPSAPAAAPAASGAAMLSGGGTGAGSTGSAGLAGPGPFFRRGPAGGGGVGAGRGLLSSAGFRNTTR